MLCLFALFSKLYSLHPNIYYRAQNKKLLEHNRFERKFQQLTFPMDMEITIPQDDPVRLRSAQLEKLDYRKLITPILHKEENQQPNPGLFLKCWYMGTCAASIRPGNGRKPAGNAWISCGCCRGSQCRTTAHLRGFAPGVPKKQ